MPFAYYRSLSRKDKAIYDASDRVASIALPRAEACTRWWRSCGWRWSGTRPRAW